MKWWSALWLAALFLPPIPLSFTPTSKSRVSAAVVVAAGYLFWRFLICRRGTPHVYSLYAFPSLLLASYLVGHAFVFGLFKERYILLMEGQWVVYFLSSISMLWDMRHLRHMEKLLVRRWLLWISIEAVIGIATAFTGPVYGYIVGAYAPRFGLSIYRATGTFGSANGLAGFLSFAAILSLWLPTEFLPTKRIVISALLLGALAFTQSRSGMLSFVIGNFAILFFAVWANVSGEARKFPRQILVLAPTFTFAAAFVIMLWGGDLHRLIDTDYAFRWQLARSVLDRYMNGNVIDFVFGYGFRQTAYIADNAWFTAHNSYISFLAETGIAGFVALIAIFVITLTGLYNTHRWYWLGGVIGLLAHLATETFLYGYLYVMLISLTFGIACLSGRGLDAADLSIPASGNWKESLP